MQEKLRAAGVWLYRGRCAVGSGEKGRRGRGRGGPVSLTRAAPARPDAARRTRGTRRLGCSLRPAPRRSGRPRPGPRPGGSPGEGGLREEGGAAWGGRSPPRGGRGLGEVDPEGPGVFPEGVFFWGVGSGGRSSPAESGSLSSVARSAPLDEARQRSWDAPCGRTRRGGKDGPS